MASSFQIPLAKNHNAAKLLLLVRVVCSTAGERSDIGVKEGDEVLYGKYGGTDIEVDGGEYKILRESDILAKIVS